jgi:hypothetical protein
MMISKSKAAGMVPFEATKPPPPLPTGGQKSLTVKLEAADYAALRAYCYEQERASGSRLTHQMVMVQALKAFLDTAKS